jgi:xanthine dehydrogenase small subunit
MHPATSPSPAFAFRLNGQTVSVAGTDPQRTLLDHIRDLGLTGAKEGCAEGECGACTVVLVKENGHGSEYRPVNSCLMLLPMAAGQEIYTVESLGGAGFQPADRISSGPPAAGRESDYALHPVQQALAERGGSQCGYCTPGFVMSLFAEYYRPGRQGHCEPEALAGNLCRCTGYRPIRDAALALGPAPDDPFQRRLAQPAPALEELAYSDGKARFSRPASLAACLEGMRADPTARLVAGGTDLVVEASLRGASFPRLISLESVPELRALAETDDYVDLGAGLTLNEIGALWRGAPAPFREWLTLFASPLIRNRATLGGNLATASPIGDAAPLLLALDAQVRIAATGAERMEPLAGFFIGYRKTILQPGELIVSIRIPKPVPELLRFYKVAKRKLDDISTVAACLAISRDSAGRVLLARFAYGGVAEVPLRVYDAERAVQGRHWNADTALRAQEAVSRVVRPISDHRGSADYRLAMAKSLIGKFVHEMLEAAA